MGEVFHFYSSAETDYQVYGDENLFQEGQVHMIALLDLGSGEIISAYWVRMTAVIGSKAFHTVEFQAEIITGQPSGKISPSGMSIHGFFGPVYDLRYASLQTSLS